ncbi:YaeQ family protein [Leeia aquatica]|uniref:YaeQ family protein n=1 Tax=Leeia aquatica TaxID=2725557 RepID=A0A847SHV2_9NEIS|nr:YaeQ family protein [Leeia aquatica]NLR76946.1 YaeQ family protein [Leeia aquatica]
MALSATVFKCNLQLADLERGHYQDYALTLARHPSETDERLMVRLLAFALYADERLAFGRGLSNEDEAALAQQDYSGELLWWIDVGLPDPKQLRKASRRAQQVVLLVYGGAAADVWWAQQRGELSGLDNLLVWRVSAEDSQAMTRLTQRNMQLQCTLQDGEVWLTDGEHSVTVRLSCLQGDPASRSLKA